MILDQKLESGGLIVLDGAMGSEVARYGVPMDLAAWCGVANKTHPDTVRQVHEDYIRAGADVITANTFATSRHVLESAGLGDETRAINRRAVELAREARDRVTTNSEVAVAGSMSSMRAWVPGSLAPDPRYAPTADQEATNFTEMADTLAEAGVDIIIMEMMRDLEHSKRAITAAVATGLPVWIGISCTRRSDGRMVGWDIAAEESSRFTIDQDGEIEADSGWGTEIPLELLIDEFAGMGGTATGIMHSAPSSMSPGLDVLFPRWSGPVMAYPEASRGNSMDPDAFAIHCKGLVEGGVQIVGGCCGTTVEHIRQMVQSLPNQVGPRP
ncbi:MAG: hypothetical protein CME26_11845 [Gemmatimonadetes bacterium]|nr:hypothetical protein [Gemmatimonadota bacterium]